MVGWHHPLEGHEFEQAPGVGDGQGSLACCSPWGPQSHPQLSLATRGEDWASQGQPKGKAEGSGDGPAGLSVGIKAQIEQWGLMKRENPTPTPTD